MKQLDKIKEMFPIGTMFIPVNAPNDVIHEVEKSDQFKEDKDGNINLIDAQGEYKLIEHDAYMGIWYSCLYSAEENKTAEIVNPKE